MRVLIIWHSGVVRHYRRRLEALADRLGRDQVTVLVPQWWPEAFMRVEVGFAPDQGYEVVPGATAFTGNGSAYIFLSGLREAFRKARPTVIHLREEPWSAVAMQVAWARRLWAPSVILVFETWQNLMKWYPPPFSWWEKRTFVEVAGAIAGSVASKQVLVRRGFQKPVRVVPLGVPRQLLTADGLLRIERAKRGEFRIGYVGWLSWQKGVDVLLAGAARLAGEWSLTIVGAGPEEVRLRRLAYDLGIARRTQFLGAVPHGEALELMRGFDCLVLPSRSTPRLVEQFGRVLIEAMAQGIPVVGSSSGEIPNVIGEAGMVFPEGNGEALAVALETLSSNPELRVELGRRGRKRVEYRYTWDRVAEATLDFYASLVASQ